MMKYLKFGELSAHVVAWIIFVTGSVLVLAGQMHLGITIESSPLEQMAFYADMQFVSFIRPICWILLIKGVCEVFYWIIRMGKSRVNS